MEDETFGVILKRLREQHGLSQPQLAAAADIPVGTIRSLEQGRRAPVFATAVRLAKAIGVSLEEFAKAIADDPGKPGRPKKAEVPEVKPASKVRKKKGGK